MAAEELSLFEWRPPARDEGAPMHTPPAATGPVRLRGYQQDAKGRILDRLSVNRSVLLVLATGGGKTTIFGEIAKGWHGDVLILAHRTELLEQARARLQEMTGEYVGLEQANYWAGSQRIVVGSVQTLGSSKAYRRERFQQRFSLVIVDEAHHVVAKSYRKILEAFPGAKILGVTATPDRGDEVALGKIFETTVGPWDYLALRDEGYLVPVTALTIELGEVDLRLVDADKGDLALGQLEREMQKGNERIVAKTLELAGSRKTIVFTPGVDMAHQIAATFNRDRRLAVVVDGKTPSEVRRDLLAQHARGDVQILVNCGIATEGYDSPAVSCVAIARPTKSRSLYAQMAGRGGRVLPGLVEALAAAEDRRAAVERSAKPDMLLLDFVGQAGKHKLVSPIDILGGRDVDPETLARAKRIIRTKAARPEEAVAQAKAQIERERQRREAAIKGVRADVRAGQREVNPFGDGQPFVPEPVKDLPSLKRGQPMSRGLRAILGHYGYSWEELNLMDHDHGVRALRAAKARESRGLASHHQITYLKRFGVDARNMYQANALKVMGAIRANRNQPLSPERLTAILSSGRVVGGEG